MKTLQNPKKHTPSGTLDFVLPQHFEAGEPPEARGLKRDEVRLMVSHRDGDRITHARFANLPDFLRAGDVLVINTSGTMNAALPAARADGTQLELRLSTRLPAELWTVELRRPKGAATVPFREAGAGEEIRMPGGARAVLHTPYAFGSRLWVASLSLPTALDEYLELHGAPIRYAYVRDGWPLDYYQTVYATETGSAEMPSAGRAFTPELITRLVANGVQVAPLLLHTGVASLEDDEPPYEEFYKVPPTTVRLVNDAHAAGGRVVAVGTTVVRALETVTGESGEVHPGEGWTGLAHYARARRPGGGRAADRPARTALHAPDDAGGARRSKASGAGLRGSSARGIPLARVRGLALDPIALKPRRGLQRDKPPASTLADSAGAVADVEFRIEGGDVELDRVFADMQLVRDHLVGHTGGEQVKDLTFPRREVLVRFLYDSGRFRCFRHQRGGRSGQTVRRRQDRCSKLLSRRILRQHAPTPQRQFPHPFDLCFVSRQQHQSLTTLKRVRNVFEGFLVCRDYHVYPGKRRFYIYLCEIHRRAGHLDAPTLDLRKHCPQARLRRIGGGQDPSSHHSRSNCLAT